MRSRNKLLVVTAVAWLLSLSPGWAQADVRALARLWQQHVRAPTEHAALVQSAQQMASQFADSPLLPVARGLGAWHALAAGQTNNAILLLTPLLAERSDPLGMEARTMAQRWLTRLDREQVSAALQSYYRNHVEFPISLEAFNTLPITNRPPLLDRFGRAWKYELTALKRLTSVRAQSYRLQSHVLGDDSDLATALRRPYGGGLVLWKPVRFIAAPTPGAPASVLFEKNNAKIMLAEGTQQAGTTLLFSREEMIIITDGDYWQLFAR
jgi:hypothetical protein